MKIVQGIFMHDDQYYMKRVIRLARKGIGNVSPNPAVGSVVVKEEHILAEGYHQRFGGPHAEVEALSKLGRSESSGSTLYVNLEPCNHHGKTPPCTEAIRDAGITRVVVGMEDPNPLVKGTGIARLRSAGIEVSVGMMEKECRHLNESFITCIEKERPFVTLKIAQTLDGKIATASGLSRWITGESARKEVHRMRKASDAVLVGVNTVIEDDPALTVRHVRGRGGKRIVLDSKLRTPLSAKLMRMSDRQNTIIVHTSLASDGKVKAFKKAGVGLWRLKRAKDQISIHALMRRMSEERICSVLVEGGEAVFSSFMKAGIVDRIVAFVAPTIFGEGKSCFSRLNIQHPKARVRFKEISWKRIGQDMMFEGRL